MTVALSSRPIGDADASPAAGARLLGGTLAVFTLFDFYFGAYKQGLRIFDLLAWSWLAGTLTLDALRGADGRFGFTAPRSDVLWWFVAAFSAYAGIGALADPLAWKASLAVLMGLVVFGVFVSLEVDGARLLRTLDWLILVHATCLVLQFVVYKASGHLLNFQAVTGGVPRVLSSIFRPSGLFLEPGTYSLAMVMLVLLRMRLVPRLNATAVIALATTLLTLSLFGVLAVAYVLTVQFWKRAGFWVAVGAAVLLVVLNLSTMLTVLRGLQILERLSNVHGDSSITARYGGLAELRTALATQFDVWFGRGVSYDYIRWGSSSAAFVLEAGGLLGLALLAGTVALLSAPNRGLESIAIVFLLLVAAPLWTAFFWWAWLGLIIRVTFQRTPEQWSYLPASASVQ